MRLVRKDLGDWILHSGPSDVGLGGILEVEDTDVFNTDVAELVTSWGIRTSL